MERNLCDPAKELKGIDVIFDYKGHPKEWDMLFKYLVDKYAEVQLKEHPITKDQIGIFLYDIDGNGKDEIFYYDAGANAGNNIEIKPGNTLSQIAQDHNTTVEQLAKDNNISDPDHIEAGKTLTMPTDIGNDAGNNIGNNDVSAPDIGITEPAGGTGVSSPIGNNVTDIAGDVGNTDMTDTNVGAMDTGIADVGNADGGGAIDINPGDTLSDIAMDHGTTVDHLAEANGITDVNHIEAGDSLNL